MGGGIIGPEGTFTAAPNGGGTTGATGSKATASESNGTTGGDHPFGGGIEYGSVVINLSSLCNSAKTRQPYYTVSRKPLKPKFCNFSTPTWLESS